MARSKKYSSTGKRPVKGGPAYVKAGGYIFGALTLGYQFHGLIDLLAGKFWLASEFHASAYSVGGEMTSLICSAVSSQFPVWEASICSWIGSNFASIRG